MNEDQGPAGEDHTIALDSEGISVVKRLALEEFDTPAVVFTIESSRDGAVYVQITDPLPDSIDPDDVGLHPEYDSEGWRRRGGDLQFEGRIDPGEAIETVYGLRVAEVERPAALLADPRIDELVDAEVIGDPTAEGGIDGEGDHGSLGGANEGEAVGDGMPGAEASGEPPATDGPESGDGDADPESEDARADAPIPMDAGDGDPAGDDDSTAEATPGADDSTAGEEAPTGEAAAADDAGPVLAGEESLAAALAAELEAGEVSEETKATLGDHLEFSLSNSSSVRLDSVQARLSDLEAYTDALEGIIDRLGTDEDAISDLESVREDLDAVETQLEDTAGSLDDLAERTDEVATTTEELETTAEDLEATTEAVREDLQGVRDRLDDLEDLPEAIDTIEGDLVTLRDEVAEVRTEVEDDVAELREEVEDLKSWRETLAATIGGGMGGSEE